MRPHKCKRKTRIVSIAAYCFVNINIVHIKISQGILVKVEASISQQRKVGTRWERWDSIEFHMLIPNPCSDGGGFILITFCLRKL